MVLSNYWKAFNVATKFNGQSSSSTIDPGIVNINGDRFELLCCTTNPNRGYVESNCRLKDVSGIRIGIGTGQIFPDDYALFNDITSNIGSLTFAVNNVIGDVKFSSIITVSGVNDSESDITITELGIVKTFYTYNGGATNDAMLAKLQLIHPVTVPPNGAFSFTINWDEA